jgi:hypothetical protein
MKASVARPASFGRWFARLGALVCTCSLVAACGSSHDAPASGIGGSAGSDLDPGLGSGDDPPESGGSDATGGDSLDPYGELPIDMPPVSAWSEPLSAPSALRKVKGALTGLAPTDAELAAGQDPEQLKALIDGWMTTPEFEQKMIFFLSNVFQQTSFSVLDFEFQLRKRPGAFDLPYDTFGDDAFPLLFKNLKESFARTVLELAKEGRPLLEALTTQRFMMTTALASLYMQIEMPYDIRTQNYRFNQGARPAIEDTLNPASANYLVFGYEAPSKTTTSRPFNNNCAGDATKTSIFPGNTYLFQILLGAVPRDSGNNSAGTSLLGCMEHASKPYFTPGDLADWRMVTIGSQGTKLRSYDLPALRAADTLTSALPRVSFFSTPAFLAGWNTNDSNQHRVTANQALLAALGQGYTSASAVIPVPSNLGALDGEHAVSTSVCYGCHKSLDPMRQFWGNAYDFGDRADGRKSQGPAAFAFGNIVEEGTSLVDFGSALSRVQDDQVKEQPVNRFALSLTQRLCFFANSAKCEERDPEMRRVALAFQDAGFDLKVLIRELFSSPLVTSRVSTETAANDGVTISVARRDQLCAALSARLERADLCEILTPTPTDATTPLNRLAGALPADGYSRGTEFPVTAADPNLFYRAASELVCEAVAQKVVDGDGAVYASADAAAAIEGMVSRVMGVPSTDPKHAAAVQALSAHFDAARATPGTNATAALRSTFAAACQSPPSLSLGI